MASNIDLSDEGPKGGCVVILLLACAGNIANLVHEALLVLLFLLVFFASALIFRVNVLGDLFAENTRAPCGYTLRTTKNLCDP